MATLPMRMGGLGLRSASRLRAPAFWASWADALPMFQERLPELAAQIVRDMAAEPGGCLGDLQEASNVLDRYGFVGRPSWEKLRLGARPGPHEAEPGEWPHGWQYFASSTSEHHFRETVVLSRAPLTMPTCAHILELDARTSCADAPQDCNRLFSAPSCWRDSVCH